VLVTGTVVQTVFSPVAGRLSDRFDARRVASVGLLLCALGLGSFAFLGRDSGNWFVIITLCVLGLGLALFATPLVHAVMGSVDRSYTGVTSATIATMRITGQNISLGVATLVLAVFVGRHPIGVADYPHVLTSIHVTFAILTGLCLLALAASLAGSGKAADVQEPDAHQPVAGEP
jgi:MFS family permease